MVGHLKPIYSPATGRENKSLTLICISNSPKASLHSSLELCPRGRQSKTFFFRDLLYSAEEKSLVQVQLWQRA